MFCRLENIDETSEGVLFNVSLSFFKFSNILNVNKIFLNSIFSLIIRRALISCLLWKIRVGQETNPDTCTRGVN